LVDKDRSKVRRVVLTAVHWSSGTKKAVMLILDCLMIPTILFASLSIQSGSIAHFQQTGLSLYAVLLLTTIPIFLRLGLYRAVLRYVGEKALGTVVLAVTVSSIAMFVAGYLAKGASVSILALLVYWSFALIYVAGSRSVIRAVFYSLGRKSPNREFVVIYGAGDAGVRLLAALQAGSEFEPIAFIDEKKSLQDRHINGITVFPPEALGQLVENYDVQRVLLAMPSASRRRRQAILTSMNLAGVRVQCMPELSDIVSGHARIDELRDVDVNDLLGRDPVPPNPALFRSCIEGKSVMVTGAGGSIGSELCRQIVRLSPRRLILLEISEIALYTINAELRQLTATDEFQVEIWSLLGNSHHRNRMREIMQIYGVETVYHAAAYKHVPVVENNMIEGLHNNVIGTWYAGEAAMEAGVETFVLISTDKAVNPANVMGATKRFAELVLQGLQSRTSKTRFCMVRFGNVLDSSGSVVPLFREQIRNGGPVTVTHREVIRYFMTIPEAAQLVIQAGAMGRGGDVFVLDMGQAVRIDDLARRMISLMGLTVRDESNPDGDIEIAYTGLRTAEKLYEELLIGSNVTGTEHPRILRAVEHSLPWERLRVLLDGLLTDLAAFDCKRAMMRLTDAVEEYKPTGEIQDYVWKKKVLVLGQTLEPKISVIPRRRVSDTAHSQDIADL
jgi:FlaA1/EpsC-like NDP-sugar epimerase